MKKKSLFLFSTAEPLVQNYFFNIWVKAWQVYLVV